jgi:hypothetical protein
MFIRCFPLRLELDSDTNSRGQPGLELERYIQAYRSKKILVEKNLGGNFASLLNIKLYIYIYIYI